MPSAKAKGKAKAAPPPDSDDESEASTIEPSQKFVPKDNDDEELWPIIEILQERGNKYKVRWDGVDPKTGKSWKPSWEDKGNVTDDVKLAWNKKKKEKLANKPKRKSTASRRVSIASTSRNARSISSVTARRGRSAASTNSRSTRTATPTTTRRTRASAMPSNHHPRTHDSDSESENGVEALKQEEEDDEGTAGGDDDERDNRLSTSTTKPVKQAVPTTSTHSRKQTQGTKRKLSQTGFRSEHRSPPPRSRSSTSEPDDRLIGGEDQEERPRTVKRFVQVFTANANATGSGRATKRRRLAKRDSVDSDEEDIDEVAEEDELDKVEVGRNSDGEPQSQTLQTLKDTQESHEPRKPATGKLFVPEETEDSEDDNEDERAIQQTLSQIQESPFGAEEDEEPHIHASQSKSQSPVDPGADFGGNYYDYDLDQSLAEPMDVDTRSPKVSKALSPQPTRKSASKETTTANNSNSSKSKSKAKPPPKDTGTDTESDSDIEIVRVVTVKPSAIPSTSKSKAITAGKTPAPKTTPHRAESSSSSTIQVKIGPPGKRSFGAIPVSERTSQELSESDEEEAEQRAPSPVARGTSKPSGKGGTKDQRGDSPLKQSKSAHDSAQKRNASTKKSAIFPSAVPPTGVVPSRIDEDERMASKRDATLQQEDEEDSDTDQEPPPLDWEYGSPTKKPLSNGPIREKSVVYDGDGDDLPAVLPATPILRPLEPHEMTESVLKKRLSPAARRRLHKFDHYVMEGNGDPEAIRAFKEQKRQDKLKAIAAQAHVIDSGQTYPTRAPQHQPQHSYMNDIVPETEVEESQSQEKELMMPSSSPASPHPKMNGFTAPSTPRRSSLKSRMKPRTPGSKTGSTAELTTFDDHVPCDLLQPSSKVNMNVPVNGNTNKKLRPIPQISASAFHPHIQAFPSSSLPDSVIEPASSNESRQQGAGAKDGMESIEEFSPEKRKTGSEILGVVLGKRRAEENGKQSAEDIWESDIVQRGTKMAEDSHKRQKREQAASSGAEEEDEEEEDGSRKRRRKSLQDVEESAQARIRAFSSPAGDDDEDANAPALANNQDSQEVGTSQETQDAVANASTTVVPSASEPHAITSQSEPPSQPVANSSQSLFSTSEPQDVFMHPASQDAASGPVDAAMDVDLSLEYATPQDVQVAPREDTLDDSREEEPQDHGSESLNKAFLREEEEEDTQDIMAELEALEEERAEQMRLVDVDAGWDLRSKEDEIRVEVHGPESNSQEDARSRDEEEFLDVPQITIEQPSRAPSVRSESVLSDQPEVPETNRPMTRSRSRSRSQTPASVVSSSSKRGKGKAKAKPLDIPSPIQSRGATPEKEEPVKETSTKMEAVQAKSSLVVSEPVLAARIAALELQITDERRKAEVFELELHAMRIQMKETAEQSSNLDASSRQEIADLQARWASEQASWEDERIALKARISTLENGKALADKDCDFFREQYGKASGFATSVREENKDLEKRIRIAEEQTSKGVELVRSTLELRIKSLEDDTRAWRSMAEFAIEKDRRTNDDIRRRAAEEPELRTRCERQRLAIEVDEEKIEDLEADLMEMETKLARANAEITQRTESFDRLQLVYNEALIKLDRIADQGDEPTQVGGNDLVWRCMWGIGSENCCHERFFMMRELEEHSRIQHVDHLDPSRAV